MEVIVTLVIETTHEQTIGGLKDFISDAVLNYGSQPPYHNGVNIRAIAAARPEEFE